MEFFKQNVEWDKTASLLKVSNVLRSMNFSKIAVVCGILGRNVPKGQYFRSLMAGRSA